MFDFFDINGNGEFDMFDAALLGAIISEEEEEERKRQTLEQDDSDDSERESTNHVHVTC